MGALWEEGAYHAELVTARDGEEEFKKGFIGKHGKG